MRRRVFASPSLHVSTRLATLPPPKTTCRALPRARRTAEDERAPRRVVRQAAAARAAHHRIVQHLPARRAGRQPVGAVEHRRVSSAGRQRLEVGRRRRRRSEEAVESAPQRPRRRGRVARVGRLDERRAQAAARVLVGRGVGGEALRGAAVDGVAVGGAPRVVERRADRDRRRELFSQHRGAARSCGGRAADAAAAAAAAAAASEAAAAAAERRGPTARADRNGRSRAGLGYAPERSHGLYYPTRSEAGPNVYRARGQDRFENGGRGPLTPSANVPTAQLLKMVAL